MASDKTKLYRAKVSRQILGELRTRYPVLFDPTNPKPLKIGILPDIYQAVPDRSHMAVKRFLRWWTQQVPYCAVRRAAEKGEIPRMDLSGNECSSGPE